MCELILSTEKKVVTNRGQHSGRAVVTTYMYLRQVKSINKDDGKLTITFHFPTDLTQTRLVIY